MIVALHSPQHVVTANERNSPLKELCLVLYTNIVCKDLQQLYDRVGSQSTSAPIKAYIRKIPDITLDVLSAGHASASYASLMGGL